MSDPNPRASNKEAYRLAEACIRAREARAGTEAEQAADAAMIAFILKATGRTLPPTGLPPHKRRNACTSWNGPCASIRIGGTYWTVGVHLTIEGEIRPDLYHIHSDDVVNLDEPPPDPE